MFSETAESSRFGEALAYATAAHAGQVRKGTSIPYIYHPVAVSAIVIEHGGAEDQVIAALLHDVLEDCGAHHASQIEARFGAQVLELVEGLTDGLPDAAGLKPAWRARKERYLEHLALAEDRVVLVSAADKLHNAQAIANDYERLGDVVFERFSVPKPETVWYYQSLVDVFSSRLGGEHPMVQHLRSAIRGWTS